MVVAGQMVLDGAFSAGDALRIAGANALPWALLLTPLVHWVERFPLERGRWRRSLPAHFALGLTLAFLVSGVRGAHPVHPGPRGVASPVAPPPNVGDGRPGEPPAFMPPPRPIVRMRFEFAVYCLMVAAIQYRRAQRRWHLRETEAESLRATLAQARADALTRQLSPHFLFNALNAVSSLVHDAPDKADDMIAALGELLRATLRLGDRREHALGDELVIVNLYVEIQRIRFGERLRFSMEVQPAAETAAVPCLLLQPLVENAFKHGVESVSGPVAVTLRARVDHGRLVLEVEDNGRGLVAAEAAEPGLGLQNTRDRLRLLCGDTAVLELAHGGTGGALCRCSLPLKPVSGGLA